MSSDQPNNSKQIVLVTGSSGCLGQHLIRYLHENDDSVSEIRCYDIKPYPNNLQHKIIKEMQVITADIRNQRQLTKAMEGVDVVIHCAALIDIELIPNEKELYSINVEGTQKVIDAAVESNVPYLINISGTDVIIGGDPIYYGSENTTIVPKNHLLTPYSKTKCQSEEIVREANGRNLANGVGKLMTLSLRPTLIYGEEDKHFVTKMLAIAKCNSGFFRRIDNIFIRFQPVYAGNVAHACVKAKQQMLIDQSVGGEEFFITDDTKILDPFEFVEPYIKARGYQLTPKYYPFWLFIIIFSLFCWFSRSFYRMKLPSGLTPSTVRYLCNTFFFNRTKSTLRIDYEPLYNHDESQQRSLPYYKQVPL